MGDKGKVFPSTFRLFGVLRFVIQPSLLRRRQPMNAEPQNIEQANFESWRRNLAFALVFADPGDLPVHRVPAGHENSGFFIHRDQQ